MKHLLLFLIIPMLSFGQADHTAVTSEEWMKNYDKALKAAEQADKNVLVYFTGSDWCPPCKMLKTDLFDSEAFATLSQSYILLYIDIPMNRDLISPEQLTHNKELSDKLNKKNSVPLITILNSKGKELDRYAGYSMTGDTSYHISLLQKHQKMVLK